MTWIRSVPKGADTDEAISIRTENAREWLEDAKQQGYRNPAPLAFAIEELIQAIDVLAGEITN